MMIRWWWRWRWWWLSANINGQRAFSNFRMHHLLPWHIWMNRVFEMKIFNSNFYSNPNGNRKPEVVFDSLIRCVCVTECTENGQWHLRNVCSWNWCDRFSSGHNKAELQTALFPFRCPIDRPNTKPAYLLYVSIPWSSLDLIFKHLL